MEGEQLKEWINTIKGYFRSMTLGNISVSPYDTAWVALVPALDGSGGPQFPKSLQWIIDNQLPDGDWAACDFFLGFDRVCNTLACVIALKTWRSGAENVERGKCPVQYHLITTPFELQRSMYAVMYDHRPSFTFKRRLHRFESPTYGNGLISWTSPAELIEFGHQFHFNTGLEFIRLNLGKIEEGDPAHMPIGFEIVFPTMLEEAKALGLDLP
jgi:hypothetical protein